MDFEPVLSEIGNYIAPDKRGRRRSMQEDDRLSRAVNTVRDAASVDDCIYCNNRFHSSSGGC